MAVLPAAKKRKLSPPEPSDHRVVSPPQINQPNSTDDFFARAAGWNLEQDYEQRSRKRGEKHENIRLPIKTADGRIEQLPVSEINDEDKDIWLDSDGDEEKVPDIVQQETKVPIRQQIIEAKEELARIASLINENPEEHVGAFRTLASIAASSNPTIKKLALATQLTVFKDAIPGYRIRPIAEAEQTEKVSKEVRKLRAFEQTLVSSYQGYVKDLAACAKPQKGEETEVIAKVSSVAIFCACALLHAVPHFNFRGELLKILVAKLSSRSVDANFVKCRETVESLFRDDEDGTSSLDAVALITKMMKARNFEVDESVLNLFLHLRLLSELNLKGSQNRTDKITDDETLGGKRPKKKREFRTKKERKIMKEQKVVEKEFREADAIVSHEHRDKMQSETLKLVFVTYFRILKARTPNLMGAVLEGLAKYAHLINQDFFGDLLEALKDLISDAEAVLDMGPEDQASNGSLPSKDTVTRDVTRESLLCTTTAFALLEGQDAARAASSLSLDLTFFTSHLYKSLHTLVLNPDLELSSRSLRLPDPNSSTSGSASNTITKVNFKTTTVLLLQALASILTPRTVSPVRLAAFIKQLLTCSVQLPEKSVVALLGLLTNVTKIHGRKIAALWNTEERRGDGVFDSLRGDLEGSNPFASTVWEGELLKLHYAPKVRAGTEAVEKVISNLK